MRKTFFDLGVGVKSSEAWSGKWKDFTVLGFEPDIGRFVSLRNVFPGLLLNYAVSDKDYEVMSGQVLEGSGFIAGGYPNLTEWVSVRTITLDTIDRIFGGFDEIYIWADIEGSELLALKGAEEVLKKTKWLNVEVRKKTETENWCKAHEVYEFLTQRGFKVSVPLEELPDYHLDVIFYKP